MFLRFLFAGPLFIWNRHETKQTTNQADFETKQPLGVVLERSKEWAIVKLANPELSQVSIGSALASVNGESNERLRESNQAKE